MDRPCTACGHKNPDFSRVCEHCGHHDGVQQQALPSLELPFQQPIQQDMAAPFDFEHPAEAESKPSELPDTSLVAAAASPAEPVSRRRDLIMVAGALVVGGGLTLALLMARAVPPAAVAAAPAPAKTKPVTAAHTRGWTTANASVWASDRNGAAFELEAENTVSVWMRTVRPMLVVRCAGGSVEAFVFTSSAAKIEPQTEDHTVKFKFDDGLESSERWPDSEEHDALFAPDGAAFARRITGAHRLQFGFTPHNASPVTAEFNVGGLNDLISRASKPCGWTR
jgi:hypothetical protein